MAPLIHSKKPTAISQNIKTEMAAGKPQRQAIAIAENVPTHKAEGGEIQAPFPLEEGGEAEAVDSELNDMLGTEIMDAIVKKDRKEIMKSLEALVLMCINKDVGDM